MNYSNYQTVLRLKQQFPSCPSCGSPTSLTTIKQILLTDAGGVDCANKQCDWFAHYEGVGEIPAKFLNDVGEKSDDIPVVKCMLCPMRCVKRDSLGAHMKIDSCHIVRGDVNDQQLGSGTITHDEWMVEIDEINASRLNSYLPEPVSSIAQLAIADVKKRREGVVRNI